MRFTPRKEDASRWRAFLQSLKDRGLRGVKLVTSDAHEGLGAARRAVLGSTHWQRCYFHLQQNAAAYVPRKSMRAEVAADIRDIFNAPDRATAEKYLQMAIQKYAKTAPRLSAWLDDNLAEGFTFFDFPIQHRRFIRTTNSLERVNREIRRRTKVAGIFPNEASCLRLISAILMEISEKWQIGKRYCFNDSSNIFLLKIFWFFLTQFTEKGLHNLGYMRVIYLSSFFNTCFVCL